MVELKATLLNILKAIGKYRWQAVAIAWIVALVGWAVVWRMPNQYQASAKIYVDTQTILKPLMSGMTSLPNLDMQVGFMRRTLISRPNVERVMRMVDLDVKAATPKDKEKMVDDITANIKIAGTERDNIFTISYTAADPKLGKEIVQSLLTIFVEGSFSGKKEDSQKAVQFIDDQIRNYEEKLAAAENSLKEFKIKNLGLLPGQGGDFSNRLMAATDVLNQARLELAEAEQSRNAIRARMNGGTSASAGAGTPPPPPMSNPELEERIIATQKSLDTMRLQYTEEHPDIVASKRLLEQLLARQRDEAKNVRRSSDPGAGYSPMMQQLSVSLSDAEARVAALRARVNEYSARVAVLRARSTEAPEIEAQLAQLNRDYDVYRGNYQQLVERRESARLSGDLSSATDMLTFRVIEPPSVPTLPFGPNRTLLASGVFLAALAAGLVGAFLLSQLRPTFLTRNALMEATNLPVLGSISMNWTDEQKARRKRRLYSFTASIATLLCLYGAFMSIMLVRPNL